MEHGSRRRHLLQTGALGLAIGAFALPLVACGSANQTAALVKRAQCMRSHGVPNYPDPVFGHGGRVVERPLSFYGINADSPASLRAAKACRAD